MLDCLSIDRSQVCCHARGGAAEVVVQQHVGTQHARFFADQACQPLRGQAREPETVDSLRLTTRDARLHSFLPSQGLAWRTPDVLLPGAVRAGAPSETLALSSQRALGRSTRE